MFRGKARRRNWKGKQRKGKTLSELRTTSRTGSERRNEGGYGREGRTEVQRAVLRLYIELR